MEGISKQILDLIHKKCEGEYWDFKEKPHENNADLLHDILCLANVKHNGSRFLIWGVDDSANGANILGITPNAQGRKNQQQMIDFLRSKSFSGDVRPEINLYTIVYEGKEIDVLSIADHPLKPYYLTKLYTVGKTTVRPYHIYTRVGDTNTPKDQSADPIHIEQMWRQRFHLDVPPKEKMLLLLGSYNDWEMDLGNIDYAYNRTFPEFKIHFGSLERFSDKEAYCYFYPNPEAFLGTASFYYNGTLLFEQQYITCDEMRIYLPAPDNEYISQNRKPYGWFFYYNMDNINGKFLALLTKNNYSFSSRGGMAPFLLFTNDIHQDQFKKKVESQINSVIVIPPSRRGEFAIREKKAVNDENVVDPIFWDQIKQFFDREESISGVQSNY